MFLVFFYFCVKNITQDLEILLVIRNTRGVILQKN